MKLFRKKKSSEEIRKDIEETDKHLETEELKMLKMGAEIIEKMERGVRVNEARLKLGERLLVVLKKDSKGKEESKRLDADFARAKKDLDNMKKETKEAKEKFTELVVASGYVKEVFFKEGEEK